MVVGMKGFILTLLVNHTHIHKTTSLECHRVESSPLRHTVSFGVRIRELVSAVLLLQVSKHTAEQGQRNKLDRGIMNN